MRLVPVESIREGSCLAKTVYDGNNRVLIKKGQKLTSSILVKIKEYNIFSLFITDEYSEREIEAIIKPQLREKSVKVLKDTFTNIDKLHCLFQSESCFSSIGSAAEKDECLSSVYALAEELIDNILSNNNILVSLVDIKTMDNCTYDHSVNVAVLSLVIGLGIRLNRLHLRDLCIGALIHDIGKVLVPKNIILKEGPLNSEEYEVIKGHTEKGYDYLRNISGLTTGIRLIAQQHHERVDGLGYPKGLKGDEISLLSKIVAVADVYDALTSNRPYRKAMLPNEALEYIMAYSGRMFDHSVVTAFSKIVVPYPNGTVVKLSNGDIGIVLETPFNYPLRPDVRIIKSSQKSKIGRLIRLIKELSIVILEIEYEI